MLRLALTDVVSASVWTWVLHDETGTELARQAVTIEPDDPTLAIVDDLYRNLWRISSGPQQPFLDRMGEFVRERLLGEVGRALAGRAPVTVGVELGPATSLLRLPFELAGLDRVTFCYHPGGRVTRPPERRGRPRVLGVFALPGESSALALSRERRAMEARFAAYGDAVELRTLQYGVTRQTLREALADPAGWDILHVAGHGRAGRLFLEKDDDTRDPVTAAEFTAMLTESPRPPGLVVLSTCESGAVRVLRRLRQKGVPAADLARQAGRDTVDGTENLGYQVAERLGCAVVAMRYPVDDDFSVAFDQRLYDGLLMDARPIDHVMGTAVTAAADGKAALSAATPMLFGDPSFRLLPQRPVTLAGHQPAPGVQQPERFVGRSAVMTRLVNAEARAVLLTGMPGIGKSACLAEAAAWYRRRGREVIRYRVSAGETAGSLLTGLGAGVRDRDVVVVLDDLDAAPQVAEVVASLCAPGGRATMLMAARRPMAGLAAFSVVVPLLTRSESELLAREVNEQALIDGGGTEASNAWPWLVGRGHPALIDGRATGPYEARCWEVFTPVPAGRPTLRADHPGRLIELWAAGAADALSPAARLLWGFLSALEGPDRHEKLVTMLWRLVGAERQVAVTDLDSAYGELVRLGMAQHWDHGRYLLHPAVARAGRDSDPGTEQLTAGMLAALWENRYETWSQAETIDEDNLGHAAASSVPYLMRLGRWLHASTRAEEAINHDRSPSMAARLVPFLNEIVDAQADPRLRRASRFVRATVLADLHPQRAREELEAVFTDATDAGDRRTQVAAAVGIATILTQQNPVEAADWLQRAGDVHEGDLSTVPLIRVKYAKIAYELGDHAAALQQAEAVLADLGPEAGEDAPRVNVNSVRLEVLELAAAAAHNLGDRETEIRLRDEVDHELDRQGAGTRARSISQFNRLTSTGEAGRGLLVAARSEFGHPADQRESALVTMRLAALDRDRHNDREAIDLAHTALHSAYAGGDLWTAADIHEDLAELHARRPEPDRPAIAAHLLASAVIGLRAAGMMLALSRPEQLERALMMLTFLLARRPDDLPRSLPRLAATISETAGVDLRKLLAGVERVAVGVDPDGGGPVLRSKAEDGDSVTDALTFATHWPPPADLIDPLAHPEHWQPMKAVFIDPAAPPDQVATTLDRLRATGWVSLASALEQLRQGTEPDADALDAIDRAVLNLIRDRC
ncbi:CHAT domain-containing protein [Actinoplanes sp. NPDC049596]|uniref:CHAT domain-containing protein n=1 Tax=unclassified Actinoplanes TaxID=2626549 RepID=UPI003432957B